MTSGWGDPDPNRTWRPGVTGGPPPAAPPATAASPATAPPTGEPERPPTSYPPAAGGEWAFFPPPGQYPTPWEPVVPVPFAERAKPHLLTFGMATAALTLLGAPLALLWRAVATPPVVLQTAAGPQPAALESDQVFAVDGWFVVVSLLAGAVVGAVAWLLLRNRGPAAPLGIAAGGIAAAAVAAAVGRRLVVDRYLYDFCDGPEIQCFIYDGTLRLHSLPALVVLPVALLAAFVVLTLAFDRERHDAEPPPYY
ncbi:MAG TPA: hypothetical protein VNA20_18200 [Frankiaceae bacterium]|nr:hypothetical protein [Frankiaceae bacterium]